MLWTYEAHQLGYVALRRDDSQSCMEPAMGISTPLELGPQCPLLGKADLCCLYTVLRQRRPLTAARSAGPIRLRPQCSRSYTVMKPLTTEPHCGTPDLEVLTWLKPGLFMYLLGENNLRVLWLGKTLNAWISITRRNKFIRFAH